MLLLFLFMLTFATITTPMARDATTTVCILFVIRDTCTVVFAWMTWARRLQSKDKTRQISKSFHSWSITTVWLKLTFNIHVYIRRRFFAKKNCFQIYSMAFKRRGSRRNRFCKSRRRQKNCVLKENANQDLPKHFRFLRSWGNYGTRKPKDGITFQRRNLSVTGKHVKEHC